MEDKTYFFAYGTLRRDLRVDVKSEIEKELAFVSLGWVKAELYDLGSYPGAVRAGDKEMEGDVFEVLNKEKVFQLLDEYEGEEYLRALTSVKLDSDGEIEAWIYWYKGLITKKHRIKEESYIAHLENKKQTAKG